MFIALKRLQAILGKEEALEQVSHAICRWRDDFKAWDRSKAFCAARHGADDNEPLYPRPPRLAGYDVVQTVTPS